MCQVWFHAFSVKSDQGSQRRPKGIAVYVNFSIPPSLVVTQVKKSLKITFLSISPYSQHFIFSFLPTFSPRFLPLPYFFRPFLPSPYCVPPPLDTKRKWPIHIQTNNYITLIFPYIFCNSRQCQNYRKCREELSFSKNWSRTFLHCRFSVLFPWNRKLLFSKRNHQIYEFMKN